MRSRSIQVGILISLLIILTIASQSFANSNYQIRTTKVWTTKSQFYIDNFRNPIDKTIEYKIAPVAPWAEFEVHGAKFTRILEPLLGFKTERKIIEQGAKIKTKVPPQSQWQLNFIIIYEHKRGDIYYQGQYLSSWYSKEAVEWFWSSSNKKFKE